MSRWRLPLAGAALLAAATPLSAQTPAPPPVEGREAEAPTQLRAASAAAPDFSLRNHGQAWRELAAWWKVSLAEGEPCAAAARQELGCFRSEDGGLPMIRQLNRPALLTLYDDAGKPAYALLVGLTGDSASLRTGSVTQTVGLASLAKAWRGEFATLWRVPPDYHGKFAAGQAGPLIDWLAVQLARANGEPAPSGPRRFDAALQQQIATFQLAQGLKPDGRVGPMTLMQLNRVAGVDEPRLPLLVASN